MDWGAVVENFATAAGAVAAVVGVILGGKLIGPEARKSRADSTMVMSDATIKWHNEFTHEAAYVDALEATLDECRRWHGKVCIIIDAACPSVTLPPFPEAPKRPPRTT